ncbi:MAG: hypothetical protein VB875_01685 [Pirellulales bacterium]
MEKLKAVGFGGSAVARLELHKITLGRWPEEMDLPFAAVTDAHAVDLQRHETTNRNLQMPTVRLNPAKARPKVGTIDETQPIEPGSSCATFRVDLPKGSIDLRTYLIDKSGKSRAAYYVYIHRVR